jgi:hypothetical protein
LDDGRIYRALSRLHVDDREVLQALVMGRVSQSEYGNRLGISQAAVSARIKISLVRLDWTLNGAGSLFTSGELRDAISPHLPEQYVVLLVTLWATTSPSETARRTGQTCHPDRYRRLTSLVETLSASRPALVPFGHGLRVLAGSEGHPGRLGVLYSWVASVTHNDSRQGTTIQTCWRASDTTV